MRPLKTLTEGSHPSILPSTSYATGNSFGPQLQAPILEVNSTLTDHAVSILTTEIENLTDSEKTHDREQHAQTDEQP